MQQKRTSSKMMMIARVISDTMTFSAIYIWLFIICFVLKMLQQWTSSASYCQWLIVHVTSVVCWALHLKASCPVCLMTVSICRFEGIFVSACRFEDILPFTHWGYYLKSQIWRHHAHSTVCLSVFNFEGMLPCTAVNGVIV